MTIELFPAIDPEYDLEPEAPTKVDIDCPKGDSSEALMREWCGGKAAFLCLGCGEVWAGEPVTPDPCDLGIGAGLHCGLPYGHDEVCAVTS